MKQITTIAIALLMAITSVFAVSLERANEQATQIDAKYVAVVLNNPNGECYQQKIGRGLVTTTCDESWYAQKIDANNVDIFLNYIFSRDFKAKSTDGKITWTIGSNDFAKSSQDVYAELNNPLVTEVIKNAEAKDTPSISIQAVNNNKFVMEDIVMSNADQDAMVRGRGDICFTKTPQGCMIGDLVGAGFGGYGYLGAFRVLE